MGRPFLVEFDDLDTGKFYIYHSCRTPFTRNSGAVYFLMRQDEEFEAYIHISNLLKVSNVMESGIVHEVHEVPEPLDWHEIYCVA